MPFVRIGQTFFSDGWTNFLSVQTSWKLWDCQERPGVYGIFGRLNSKMTKIQHTDLWNWVFYVFLSKISQSYKFWVNFFLNTYRALPSDNLMDVRGFLVYSRILDRPSDRCSSEKRVQPLRTDVRTFAKAHRTDRQTILCPLTPLAHNTWNEYVLVVHVPQFSVWNYYFVHIFEFFIWI